MLIRIVACGTPAFDDVVSASVPVISHVLQCASTYGAAVAVLLHRMHAYWLGLGLLRTVLGSAGISALLGYMGIQHRDLGDRCKYANECRGTIPRFVGRLQTETLPGPVAALRRPC